MHSDALLVVCVDTPEEEVDSEICNHNADKRQQTVEVKAIGTLKHTPMQRDGIDNEGDERPYLLGVP